MPGAQVERDKCDVIHCCWTSAASHSAVVCTQAGGRKVRNLRYHVMVDLTHANRINVKLQVASNGNCFPSLEDNKGISIYLKLKMRDWVYEQCYTHTQGKKLNACPCVQVSHYILWADIFKQNFSSDSGPGHFLRTCGCIFPHLETLLSQVATFLFLVSFLQLNSLCLKLLLLFTCLWSVVMWPVHQRGREKGVKGGWYFPYRWGCGDMLQTPGPW
jgi:hypothetical protein